jgi:transporter family protein
MCLGRSLFPELLQISPKSLLFLVISGITIGLSWLCYFKALQLGSPVAVAALDKSSLVMIFILSVVFLGESLTLKTTLGTALILTGVLVLI